MRYQVEKRSSAFTASPTQGLSPLPHIHSHLEIIYASTGSSITTLDNQEFLLEDGDLFLSFPNQIHFYYDQRPVDGYMVIFSPDMFRDLKEDFHNKRPTCPVIKRTQLPSDIRERLAVITAKNASDSPYDRICAKGHLLALLGELIPLMDLIPVSADHDSIKNLMNYCSENYTENLTLDSVSKELHLSKYYISHIFKERMNIGFTDFINSLRTEHACELLKKDVSITDVAFSSGFSSIRTFNRVFLENTGMTPRDYIKAKQN